MLGAVFGDIVGSAYEWNNVKTKDFPLQTPHTRYTDDSVMTLAVAQWLMEDPKHTEKGLIKQMQRLGRHHFNAGYGGRFKEWLQSKDPQPYGSWGNGSAMRVSPVGLYASSVEEARELARISAIVTHNHPEGIKGAMAVAECVFLNKDRRHGMFNRKVVKAYIRAMIQKEYGYDLRRKLDDIRPNYKFDVSCQGSVPEAIIVFLESESLEDCVRNAVSLGGDSDTIAAIACSIFVANKDGWDMPLMSQFTKYLPDDLRTIMDNFEELFSPRKPIRNSYMVMDRVYAGEYPRDLDETKSTEKIKQFERFGITHFVDLTEEGELRPYSQVLGSRIRHIRFPIKDVCVPESTESVKELIKQIKEILKSNERNRVYIHCWGGVGRTGVIVGCLLSEQHKYDYEETMRALTRAFSDCPKSAYRETPETNEQREFIAKYVDEKKQEILSKQALMMWTLGLGDSSKRFAGENPLPKKDKVATKDSWKIQPMGKHVVIPFDKFLPEDVMDVIRYGHIPAAMEDHWFMYCDENAIRYYRSWTGICVFVAEYEDVEGGIKIVRLLSRRDSEQNDFEQDTKDAALFLALLTQEYGGDSSKYWNVFFDKQ